MIMENWFKVVRLSYNTFAISEEGHSEHAHSFLFIGRSSAALVDSGLGIGDIGAVVRELTCLPVTVLTTHAHWDHIGGHDLFDNIAIHQDDAGWLEIGIPLPKGELERAFCDQNFTNGKPAWFDTSKYIVHRGKPDRLLTDGEVIDLGDRKLTIVHTPGHSPGHVCIYEAETGYLATGDLVYDGTLFCNFPSTDPDDYLESLNKISGLRVTKILPGHNSLSIPPSLIKESLAFLASLSEKSELHHGVGLKTENGISILL